MNISCNTDWYQTWLSYVTMSGIYDVLLSKMALKESFYDIENVKYTGKKHDVHVNIYRIFREQLSYPIFS